MNNIPEEKIFQRLRLTGFRVHGHFDPADWRSALESEHIGDIPRDVVRGDKNHEPFKEIIVIQPHNESEKFVIKQLVESGKLWDPRPKEMAVAMHTLHRQESRRLSGAKGKDAAHPIYSSRVFRLSGQKVMLVTFLHDGKMHLDIHPVTEELPKEPCFILVGR